MKVWIGLAIPLLFLGNVVSARQSASGKPVPDSAPEAKNTDLPCWGISVAAPQGWVSVTPSGLHEAAKWYRIRDPKGLPIAGMSIEVRPVKDVTLRRCAEAFAKDVNGKVRDEPVTLDGLPALRVSGNAKYDFEFVKSEIIVCLREGHLYALADFAEKQEKAGEQIEQLIKGWKWQPIADPAGYLDLGKSPTQVFHGWIEIQLPELMRRLPAKESRSEGYVIFDYRADFPALAVAVENLPNPEKLRGPKLRSRLGALLQQKLDSKTAVSWTKVAGPSECYLSNPLPAIAQRGVDPEKSFMRCAVFELPDKQVAVFTFTVANQDEKDRALYDDAIVRTCASARPTDAPVSSKDKQPGLPAKPADNDTTGAKTASFPNQGLTVRVPAEWQFEPGGSPDLAGSWRRTQKGNGLAAADVHVEIARMGNNELRGYAEETAKRCNGLVQDDTSTLDGITALRIKGKLYTDLDNCEILVCRRDRFFYALWVGTAENLATGDDLETFRKGWKWQPFADPTERLGFGESWVSLLGDSVKVKLPTEMKSAPIGDANVQTYVVYDYRADVSALAMDVRSVPNPGKRPGTQSRDVFGVLLTQFLKTKGRVTWTKVPGQAKFYLSNRISSKVSFPGIDLAKSVVRYGVLDVSRKQIVLFTFTIANQDEKSRAVYDRVIEKICASARAANASSSTKPKRSR